MNINSTFKGIEASEAVKSYTQERVNKLNKFLPANTTLNAIFQQERGNHIVELNFRHQGNEFVAHESTPDMYASIDGVVDKMLRQLKNAKEKRTDNKQRGGKEPW